MPPLLREVLPRDISEIFSHPEKVPGELHLGLFVGGAESILCAWISGRSCTLSMPPARCLETGFRFLARAASEAPPTGAQVASRLDPEVPARHHDRGRVCGPLRVPVSASMRLRMQRVVPARSNSMRASSCRGLTMGTRAETRRAWPGPTKSGQAQHPPRNAQGAVVGAMTQRKPMKI